MYAGVAAAAGQHVGQVAPQGLRQRRNAGEERGHDTRRQRDEERAPVANHAAPKIRRQKECGQHASPERRRADAGGAAEQREQQRFGEQLPDQPRAGHAERQPQRDLAPPRHGSGEQEVGDVGAGDQQDDHGDAAHPEGDFACGPASGPRPTGMSSSVARGRSDANVARPPFSAAISEV